MGKNIRRKNEWQGINLQCADIENNDRKLVGSGYEKRRWKYV